MIDQPVSQIVIVGGGTAGWMTAAALSSLLDPESTQITLIESDLIGTVGVGEATLPHLRFFNQKLGINEAEFMRETQATFKLGIEFSHWGRKNDAYIHPFGDYGQKINDIAFHQYWLNYHQSDPASKIDDYSLGVMLAKNQRFAFPSENPKSLASTYSYAYHVDAGLYAKYLRAYSEKYSVKRVEGKVVEVIQHENGDISELALDSGDAIKGDFFIDCSGFRALLIGEALNAQFISWKQWLPCDSAIAIPCEKSGNCLPYTKAIAHSAGWRWRIPLQHRTGNGVVFARDFMTTEEAELTLERDIDGKATAEPNRLRFEAGTRSHHWKNNCVAIGLSSGFLEPLESTSIYLIQSAIMKLVEFLPGRTETTIIRDEFNRQMSLEMERIRDFLILHYHMTEREDSKFWQYCKSMKIPESLAEKIALYLETGHIESYQFGLFLEPSWVAVYLGQGALPKSTNRIVENIDSAKLDSFFSQLRNAILKQVSVSPIHQVSIDELWAGINNETGKATSHTGATHPDDKAGATAKMSLYGSRS